MYSCACATWYSGPSHGPFVGNYIHFYCRVAATNLVIVSFNEPVNVQLLSGLPAAESVQQAGPNNWQLATRNPDHLRKQILELALQHNLNIVSLQNETQSLEDVFRSLTQVNDTQRG